MSKRVVLDTNQIISAGVRWMDPMYFHDGNDAVDLIKVVFTKHTGLASSGIFSEYVEKLIEKKAKPELLAGLLKRLLGAFEVITITSTSCDPSPSDQDDVIFMLCALDGNADYLVSNDDDLLSLSEDYNPPVILDRSNALHILGK